MDSENEVVVVSVVDDDRIAATAALMRQLRPNLPVGEYLGTVRRMMQSGGYRLVAASVAGSVRAVAGYRIIEMLYCGRIMYVDDLNTDEEHRSEGLGKILMDWLKSEAKAQGCSQLHLDSGVQRERTHRFYFREGLTINCYHFRTLL